MLWFGSCTLRLKWPPLIGALARNIPRKETLKPSDKHRTNPPRTAVSPAREPYFLQHRKVRLRDCRQSPLLLPRQGSAHCPSHIHAIAETLFQSLFLVVYAKQGSILWKIARFVWKSAHFLQQLLWENSFSCGFLGALRGVGGRLSQFCGTMAHNASTIILSGEQYETR